MYPIKGNFYFKPSFTTFIKPNSFCRSGLASERLSINWMLQSRLNSNFKGIYIEKSRSSRLITKAITGISFQIKKSKTSENEIPSNELFEKFKRKYNLNQDDELKLVIFVPQSHGDLIREILGNGGAGVIGNYSHCSVTTNVIGRCKEFKNGQIDSNGKYMEASEERIETVVKVKLIEKIMEDVLKAHPYKEPGYDIYPLISRFKNLST